jgi:hypothetical protein
MRVSTVTVAPPAPASVRLIASVGGNPAPADAK